MKLRTIETPTDIYIVGTYLDERRDLKVTDDYSGFGVHSGDLEIASVECDGFGLVLTAEEMIQHREELIMTYNKGDILVCSTNIYCGHEYNPQDPLIIENKYEVINCWHDALKNTHGSVFRITVIDVRNIETNKQHSCVPSTLFIGLDVYREFKLRMLENEKL